MTKRERLLRTVGQCKHNFSPLRCIDNSERYLRKSQMIHFITSLIACEIISPVRGSADLGPTFRCHGWRGKGYRDMEYEATPIYVDMQYYIDEHVAC